MRVWPFYLSIATLLFCLPNDGGCQALTARRLFRLGVPEGDRNQEFHRIADVDLVGDSLVAVASLSTMDVRLFDLRGRFVRSWGRAGGGPGEFRWIFTPGGVFVARDSLCVFDWQLRRVSVFSTAGQFGRSIDLGQFGVGSAIVLGVWPDGSFLIRSSSSELKNTTGWQETHFDLYRTRPLASVPLGRFFSGTHYMARQPAQNVQAWGSFDPPGSVQAVIAVSADGFWYADGRRPTLEKRGPDGRGQFTVPVAFANAALAEATLRAAQREWLSNQDVHWQPRIREAVQTMELPPAPPRGVVEMVVDSDGAVWYTGHDIGVGAVKSWYRYSSDGRTAHIRLPAHFRLRSARGAILAGTERDSLGVEYVTVYAIQR